MILIILLLFVFLVAYLIIYIYILVVVVAACCCFVVVCVMLFRLLNASSVVVLFVYLLLLLSVQMVELWSSSHAPTTPTPAISNCMRQSWWPPCRAVHLAILLCSHSLERSNGVLHLEEMEPESHKDLTCKRVC